MFFLALQLYTRTTTCNITQRLHRFIRVESYRPRRMQSVAATLTLRDVLVYLERLALYSWNQSEYTQSYSTRTRTSTIRANLKLDVPFCECFPIYYSYSHAFYLFFVFRSNHFKRYFGHMKIPKGKTIQDAQKPETEKYFPRNVRLLKTRWKAGMNFGEFSEATFAAFY